MEVEFEPLEERVKTIGINPDEIFSKTAGYDFFLPQKGLRIFGRFVTEPADVRVGKYK
jgi:hypothetical protein